MTDPVKPKAPKGPSLKAQLDAVRAELKAVQSALTARGIDLQDTVAQAVSLKKELEKAQAELERGRLAIRNETELTRQAQSWRIRAQGLETRLRESEEVSNFYSQAYGVQPVLTRYRKKWGA